MSVFTIYSEQPRMRSITINCQLSTVNCQLLYYKFSSLVYEMKKSNYTQPEEIRAIIKEAANACQSKNAAAFANLFTENGEIILSNYKLQGKQAIYQATADYLAKCEEITITIHRIIVEGDVAVVEWRWENKQQETGELNRSNNAIAVDFQFGLIRRWREYSATRN